MRRIGVAAAAAVAVAGLAPLLVATANGKRAPVELAALAIADDAAGARETARVLDACVTARKGGRAAAKCVGIVAEPCLATGDGAAGGHDAPCYRREAEGWSALVDAYRARLERRFAAEPRKMAQMGEAQAEWLADRARRCDGAGQDPACGMKETSRRALYLRALADHAGVL